MDLRCVDSLRLSSLKLPFLWAESPRPMTGQRPILTLASMDFRESSDVFGAFTPRFEGTHALDAGGIPWPTGWLG